MVRVREEEIERGAMRPDNGHRLTFNFTIGSEKDRISAHKIYLCESEKDREKPEDTRGKRMVNDYER